MYFCPCISCFILLVLRNSIILCSLLIAKWQIIMLLTCSAVYNIYILYCFSAILNWKLYKYICITFNLVWLRSSNYAMPNSKINLEQKKKKRILEASLLLGFILYISPPMLPYLTKNNGLNHS